MSTTRFRLPRPLLALLILLSPLRALAIDDYDRWYTLDFAGQRAGWMHSAQTTSADHISSLSDMKMEFKRGPIRVGIEVKTEFIETAAGKPVSMLYSQNMAGLPSVSTYTFSDAGITQEIKQGDQVQKATLPLPEGTWLPPAAASVYVQQRLAANAKKITLRTVDPSGGCKAITMTYDNIEHTTVSAMGKTIPAFKCNAISSDSPTIQSVTILDAAGIPVQQDTSFGAFAITMTVSDKPAAVAEVAAPEMMVSTFVKPDRAIQHPRAVRHAVYILSNDEGAIPALPATGSQKVEPVDEHHVRVTIDADPAAAAPESERADPAYRGTSAMVNTEDPEVRALVEKALKSVGDSATARQKADALRKFVYRFIDNKNLNTGFATASETARSHEGDCTEHATLLCALLRVAGIPARVASGLIYADEFAGESRIFGYHMWTQALLPTEKDGATEDRWVDEDATLDQRRFDATHIALGVTSLNDGDMQSALVSLAQLMGRVKIHVQTTEDTP
jgi:transglutaminase-like putative cysteine protease